MTRPTAGLFLCLSASVLEPQPVPWLIFLSMCQHLPQSQQQTKRVLSTFPMCCVCKHYVTSGPFACIPAAKCAHCCFAVSVSMTLHHLIVLLLHGTTAGFTPADKTEAPCLSTINTENVSSSCSSTSQMLLSISPPGSKVVEYADTYAYRGTLMPCMNVYTICIFPQ